MCEKTCKPGYKKIKKSHGSLDGMKLLHKLEAYVSYFDMHQWSVVFFAKRGGKKQIVEKMNNMGNP